MRMQVMQAHQINVRTVEYHSESVFTRACGAIEKARGMRCGGPRTTTPHSACTVLRKDIMYRVHFKKLLYILFYLKTLYKRCGTKPGHAKLKTARQLPEPRRADQINALPAGRHRPTDQSQHWSTTTSLPSAYHARHHDATLGCGWNVSGETSRVKG